MRSHFKKPNVSVFGVKKYYGGGRTRGYCVIYDNEESMKKYEPKYRANRVSDFFSLIYFLFFRSLLKNYLLMKERRNPQERKKEEKLEKLKDINFKRKEELLKNKLKDLPKNKERRRNNIDYLLLYKFVSLAFSILNMAYLNIFVICC